MENDPEDRANILQEAISKLSYVYHIFCDNNTEKIQEKIQSFFQNDIYIL